MLVKIPSVYYLLIDALCYFFDFRFPHFWEKIFATGCADEFSTENGSLGGTMREYAKKKSAKICEHIFFALFLTPLFKPKWCDQA